MTLRYRLTLLSMLAALAACDKPVAESGPVIRPVRYLQVTPLSATERRIFSGVAQAALESNLSFKVAGLVAERPVKIGDTVDAGDLLASLEPGDFQVRVREAEAGLARAQAEVRNAQSRYERTRSLYENRNASRSDLDAARAAAESGGAAVRAANQQLNGARLQLSYATLRSPQTCQVAETYARVNENVAAGQPIVKLNCGDCAEVAVTVPQTLIERIDTGAPAKVIVDALGQQAFAAIVTEVGIAAVGTTFPVTVRLIDQCPGVRSGMAADVEFALQRPDNGGVIAVPPVAVGEDAGGRYVFVLEARDEDLWQARRRNVTVRGIAGDGILIENGLQPGELIATAGVRLIEDGQLLRLQAGTGN